MNNTENKTNIEDSKRHTFTLAGIALLILAAVFAYFAVSQPGISGKTEAAGTTLQQAQAAENVINGETPNTEIPATEESPQAGGAPANIPTNAYNGTSAAEPYVTVNNETKTTAPAVSVQYPLNLNTCTAAELMTIDGIGEVRAAAIIAYREYLGAYTDIEQLKNIEGIGDGIFAKIEPYVTV